MPVSPIPTVIIDHRYFPHIIDLIWSYMPYPSLVACANACRLWRARMREHWEHCALIVYEDGSVVERSQSLDYPAVSAILSSAQSVDESTLTDDVINSCTITDIYFNLPTNLRYTRSAHDWPANFTRDFVIFDEYPDESFPASDTTVFLEYFSGHFYAPTIPEILAAPFELSLTVRCHTDPTAYTPLITTAHMNAVMSIFPNGWINEVEHFTIILDDVRPPGDSPGAEYYRDSTCCPTTQHDSRVDRNSNMDATDRDDWTDLSEDTDVPKLGEICELSLLALRMPKLKTLRFVGFECFLELDPYASALYNALDKEADVTWRQWNSLRDLTLTESSTHEEYRAKVGETRYRLQMRK